MKSFFVRLPYEYTFYAEISSSITEPLTFSRQKKESDFMVHVKNISFDAHAPSKSFAESTLIRVKYSWDSVLSSIQHRL